MKTLQQLKDSGEWQVFVDEVITRNGLINCGTKENPQYELDVYGEYFFVVTRVTLIPLKCVTHETSQGPISERRIVFDERDAYRGVFQSPPFCLQHNLAIDNKFFLDEHRRQLWRMVDVEPLLAHRGMFPYPLKISKR